MSRFTANEAHTQADPLIFILYAAALLSVVGMLAYSSGRNSLRSATFSELSATAIEKQATLNQWVEEKQTDIAALAASPTIIEEASALIAASADSPGASAARDKLIAEIQPRILGGEFLVVMLIDPRTGEVIAATDPSEEGKFKEDRPFFLNGKTDPYIQNLYYSVALQSVQCQHPHHQRDHLIIMHRQFGSCHGAILYDFWLFKNFILISMLYLATLKTRNPNKPFCLFFPTPFCASHLLTTGDNFANAFKAAASRTCPHYNSAGDGVLLGHPHFSLLFQLAKMNTPQPYGICNACAGGFVIRLSTGVFIHAFDAPD